MFSLDGQGVFLRSQLVSYGSHNSTKCIGLVGPTKWKLSRPPNANRPKRRGDRRHGASGLRYQYDKTYSVCQSFPLYRTPLRASSTVCPAPVTTTAYPPFRSIAIRHLLP